MSDRPMSEASTPWEFLPRDDDLEGDDLDAASDPEVEAMHVEGDTWTQQDARRVALEASVDLPLDPPLVEDHFPDEESETPTLVSADPDGEIDETEPDVQELLERQHYVTE